MAKKRVTGRFYFFLILLLAVIAYLLYQRMPTKATEGIVSIAISSDTRAVEAVIIRDETIFSCDGLEKTVYIAAEGSTVSAGDAIADVYATSYISKEYAKLTTTLNSIRTYQQAEFDDPSDSKLERLVKNVQQKALQLKNLVNGSTSGNLYSLQESLNDALEERRTYCKETLLENTKLIQLYQDETNRLGSISTWRTDASATASGIVSFYFDGYESLLTPDSFTSLSADILRRVIAGDTSVQTAKSSRTEQVYRIVSTEKWYAALISKDTYWSPVNGQELSFRMDGFSDLVYTGTVIGVQRSGSDVIIQLEIDDPIGPLLYQRVGNASVGIYTTGLSVPVDALYYQNNQAGVWVQGSYGISFIPVDVLSQDRDNAIVQPMQSGSLYEGQKVMIY